MKTISILFSLFISISIFSQAPPPLKTKNNPAANSNLNYIGDIKEIKGRDTTYSKKYYNTINYQLYKKKKDSIIHLSTKNEALIKKITNSSDPKKIEVWKEETQKNNNSILRISNEADTLYGDYVTEFIQHRTIVFGFGTSRSKSLFNMIYTDDKSKKLNLLNRTGVSIGNTTGSVYSELASGQMYAFRVSIGVMAASSSSNDSLVASEEEAYQKLITYGGNTVLNIEWPLLFSHGKNNQWVILAKLIGKGTADFKEMGTTTEEWAGSLSLGLDLYAEISTSNKRIKFFGMFNICQYAGNESFKNNLNTENNSFHLGQGTLGVMFDNISLSFVLGTFSSESILDNGTIISTGQVIH